MIKFRKFYDDEFNNISDAGKPTFHRVIMADPNGSEYDIKYSDDVVDIQEEIDSFKDSTDINLIVQRFTNGDLNAIGNFGVFDHENKSIVDMSVLPEDVHSLHYSADASSKFFGLLPAEIRSKYASVDDFYNSADFDKVMAALINNNVEEKEVKEGEISE